jgi:hypothetical protein
VPRSKRPLDLIETFGSRRISDGDKSRPGLACRPNLTGAPFSSPSPVLLGSSGRGGIQPAGMLLSFERPAPARRQAQWR